MSETTAKACQIWCVYFLNCFLCPGVTSVLSIVRATWGLFQCQLLHCNGTSSTLQICDWILVKRDPVMTLNPFESWKFKQKIVYKKWIIGLTGTMWGLHQVCDISSQSYTHTHTHLYMHKLNCEPPTFVDPARYGRMITKFIRFLHSSWLRLLATRQMKQMSSFNSFFAAQCVHKSWSGCLKRCPIGCWWRVSLQISGYGLPPRLQTRLQAKVPNHTGSADCWRRVPARKKSTKGLWAKFMETKWNIAIFLKHLGYVWGPLILQ